MKTFKRVLDRIDYLKANDKAFRTKDKVVALYRAGKAMLPDPIDWNSHIVSMELYERHPG